MNDRVALVTGASSGMGKETAKQLRQNGYTVYGAARRVERMKDLEALGCGVLRLDVADEESIQDCVDTILQQAGRLDILVNNAGYGSYGAVEDVKLSEARRQFEVNLFGLARLTQLVLPQMRRQRSGYIFNISSMGGKVYTPLGAWYHATKHALEGFSDCLRLVLRSSKAVHIRSSWPNRRLGKERRLCRSCYTLAHPKMSKKNGKSASSPAAATLPATGSREPASSP